MKKAHLFAAVATTLTIGAANAGIIQTGSGMMSTQPGVCTVTFNGGNATNACGATYTETGGGAPNAAHFPSTSIPGVAAQPAGDATPYFTVGPTAGQSVTISLATTANYFGFYAGSLDSFNLVQFFLNGSQVDQFNGDQINAVAFGGAASGNQQQAVFIEYFPTSLYNSIIYSSTANAFETDNHAFGIATPNAVPEPQSVALLALGALGVAVARRRRK